MEEPVGLSYASNGTHSWPGTAVVSTKVTFHGSANTFPVSASATFVVSPRQWNRFEITSIVETTAYAPPQIVDPVSAGSVLGGFHAIDTLPFTSATIDSVGSGPNKHWTFFLNRPTDPRGFVIMHPALYPGHAWYADQNGLGSGTCVASDVATWRAEARRHEGVGIATNSHAGIANVLFTQHRPDTLIEKIATRMGRSFTRIEGHDVYRDFVTGPLWRAKQDSFDLADYPIVDASVNCAFDFNLSDNG